MHNEALSILVTTFVEHNYSLLQYSVLHPLAVGYGKNALIDLENPAFAECASQSACDGVAKNAAGEPLDTLTYVADSNLVRTVLSWPTCRS